MTIPDEMLADLREVGTSLSDRLAMTPITVHSKPGRYCYVDGFVDSLAMNALVYHMDQSLALDKFDNRWLVRPFAVRRHRDASGNYVPVLMCTLLTANAADAASLDTAKSKPNAQVATLPGPDNKQVPYLEWMQKTDAGCAACKASFISDDAEDITWDEEGNPWCVSCVSDLDNLMKANVHMH
jgi:hypothetical protein